MQKLINVLAVTSFIVSAAVVGGGVYLYKEKDNLIAQAKSQVTDAIKDMLGASQIGSVLTGGVSDEDLGVDVNPPVELPVVPFGQ